MGLLERIFGKRNTGDSGKDQKEFSFTTTPIPAGRKWFKQMTCDTCYKPLSSTGRHNKYFFMRITDYHRVSQAQYKANFALFNRRDNMARMNYDTSINVPGGYVYCYTAEPLTAESFSTYFCSVKCALDYAKKTNCMMLTFDEDRGVAVAYTPQIEQINQEMHKDTYRGIEMIGTNGSNWMVKPSEYIDRSAYGNSSVFPQIALSKSCLVEPAQRWSSDYQNLCLDPGFEKYYFGDDGAQIRAHVKNCLVNHIEANKNNYGRRTMIEWYVVDKQGNFMGFIHMTYMYPALAYKWVIEFGLASQYRNQGIMSEAVKAVLAWAKKEGLDEPIYAVCEDFNTPCHKLLNNLPYNVTVQNTQMSDQFAGHRKMKIFTINL